MRIVRVTKAAWDFTPSFQEGMLSLMIRDVGFATKLIRHIPAERLYSEAHKYLFEEVKKKLERDNNIPSYIEIEENLKKVERTKRKMLRAFCKSIYEMTLADAEYIKDRCTEYARKNSFIDIFQNGQTFWNARRHDDAYKFVMEGINELYGINFRDDSFLDISDFETLRKRYIYESSIYTRRIPTNIKPLDDILRGGLEKGELGILLAEPKKGKSIGLTHMGTAALQMRFGRVAHFLLEGTTEQGTMRYQSRLSGIPYQRIEKDELTEKEETLLDRIGRRHMRNLTLIPFNQHWAYTTLDIESKIKELERQGQKPDLVIIDYGDLVRGRGQYESPRLEQTDVFRDLKRIATMHRVAIWTASQARRPIDGPEKEYLLRSKDIAESFEKVRIADLVITLNQTPKEKHMGVLRIHVDIYRSNDTDRTIWSLVDFGKMIFHSKRYGYISKRPAWMDKRKKTVT
jgi:replicative DNA helicase